MDMTLDNKNVLLQDDDLLQMLDEELMTWRRAGNSRLMRHSKKLRN